MKPDATLEDFKPHIGKTWEVAVDDTLFPVVLAQAEPLAGASLREGGPFSLIFTGPPSPILGQGLYELRCEGETQDLFIVPIGPKDGRFRYQAVFN